jgi:hypothetical protein
MLPAPPVITAGATLNVVKVASLLRFVPYWFVAVTR